jgi:UDP-galactopyranose mutase
VLASIDGRLVPMPINRTTLNAVYGADLTSDEAAEAFLRRRAERILPIRTAEDAVVSAIGRELYDKFFRDYTQTVGPRSLWLDKSVTTRVATRTTLDDRYFLDRFQAIPAAGYARCSRIC